MQDVQTLEVQTLVTGYIEAFNEIDGDRRRERLEALYTPDCAYTDPHVDLRGPEQIDGFIEQTQERFPGLMFTLVSPIVITNRAGFQWHAGTADAPDTFVGVDVIVTDVAPTA